MEVYWTIQFLVLIDTPPDKLIKRDPFWSSFFTEQVEQDTQKRSVINIITSISVPSSLLVTASVVAILILRWRRKYTNSRIRYNHQWLQNYICYIILWSTSFCYSQHNYCDLTEYPNAGVLLRDNFKSRDCLQIGFPWMANQTEKRMHYDIFSKSQNTECTS